jgi:hypothetical protein
MLWPSRHREERSDVAIQKIPEIKRLACFASRAMTASEA